MKALVGFVVLALVASTARADRPLHGGVGVGGSLLLSGDNGDKLRADVELDVEPYSRFGGLVALRGFDENHRGLLCGGLIYEAAAARPRLVLDLHADLGADLDARAPLAGGGLRIVLTVIGPLAVSYDGGFYLVIDGVDKTRLVTSGALEVVARW